MNHCSLNQRVGVFHKLPIPLILKELGTIFTEYASSKPPKTFAVPPEKSSRFSEWTRHKFLQDS